MQNEQYDFGMVGLGVMGKNLLLNMADNGFAVVGFDLNKEKTNDFEKSGKKGQRLKGVNSLKDLIGNLKKPRKIMMLVPAGKPVDSVMRDLKPMLEKGDILIDGGNSHFTDTLARIDEMTNTGIHFMGVGVSGGEDGARFGPSIMPGGDREAWEAVAPVLKAIAAKVKDEPCVSYMGKNAAGHYVKMVHNGIEYAIMQLTTECYDLMKHGQRMSNEDISKVFEDWDSGEMKSFLLEITAEIFRKKDDKTNQDLVDMILDKAGAKGTGKWTSESALNLPMPVPNIDVAVMMRNLSSLVDERKEASAMYAVELTKIDIEKEKFIDLLHDALYFATIVAYAQGLSMISAASEELSMDIPVKDVVRVWRGGCIIRSALLDIFTHSYDQTPDLKNLLLDKDVATLLQSKLPAIKDIISLAAGNNYPVPGLMAAYCYFNAYIREKSPMNLVQAQRDYFGAHTYQRVDQVGIFHTQWESKK